jgi:hypothetical protein
MSTKPQVQLAQLAARLSESQASDRAFIAEVFLSPIFMTVPRVAAPILTPRSASHFGDVLRLHHCFSDEPFTKDKFEHLFKSTLEKDGVAVKKPTTNNPGEDLTIGKERVSLKTQADQNIDIDSVQIHKFMELGRGDWGNNADDIKNLLVQFLDHISRYERIFVLRAINNPKVCKAKNTAFTDWEYELLEIPKSLLEEARFGEIKISQRSKLKTTKPATCSVYEPHDNQERSLKYNLYFDGGGERKLKITALSKRYCKVHATWKFRDPQQHSTRT